MKQQILEISRQESIGALSPWFNNKLDQFINDKVFVSEAHIKNMKNDIVEQLVQYRINSGLETCVIGMSGGIDSALTAALFKEAGWAVRAYLMPINQDPSETVRGREVCKALKIKSTETDLTTEYAMFQIKLNDNIDVKDGVTVEDKIRAGNIKARLRMITLYNEAHKNNGLVASTDNFSELAAGFWTLHGDVGDLAPIQSLLKSWEIPMMARIMGLPESVVTAKPTDGLGITGGGDEEQFGCSYLEWDVMTQALLIDGEGLDDSDERAEVVYDLVTKRINGAKFKRGNPANLVTKVAPERFNDLRRYDGEN